LPGIYSTAAHIKRLNYLKAHANLYPCHCSIVDGTSLCTDILTYAITKKKGKLGHKSLGAIPAIGTLETVRGAVKSLYKRSKGTKGANREQMARIVVMRARNGCQHSQAIITELLGSYIYPPPLKMRFSSVNNCTRKNHFSLAISRYYSQKIILPRTIILAINPASSMATGIEQESWNDMFGTINWTRGWEIVFAKLAST
jgi:hypothetical protein